VSFVAHFLYIGKRFAAQLKIHLMKQYFYTILVLLMPVAGLFAQTTGKPTGFRAGFYIVTPDSTGSKGFQLAGSKEHYFLGNRDSVSFVNIDTISKEFDPVMKKYILSFRFNKTGAKELADFTKKYTGKKIGLVIDKKLITVATIHSPITFGRMSMAGNHTEDEIDFLKKEMDEAIQKLKTK
jgi:hypothetical protein